MVVERSSSMAICKTITTEITKEERRQVLTSYVNEMDHDLFTSMVNRFSGFSKLRRVLPYCCRFIKNCKLPKENRNHNRLSANELNYAITICIKRIQQSAFQKEFADLKLNGHVSIRSKLAGLNPFFDTDGLLRVGGRMRNSGFSYSVKHPIILPKDHPICFLLADELHRIHLHPGTTLLLGIIRQKYWIIGARSIASKVYHKCVTCFRQRAARTTQLMGNLPSDRITPSRPFSKTGVDYAGPVVLSSRPGRGAKHVKGYIALFVCFATKALHLELVSSLTADAFIAALRRFISRRGIPSTIHCDNGTNFVGGRRCIKELYDQAISNAKNPITLDFLSQNQITWSFIPPGSPHFGGLWEAGVKSVKWHLRRVIGETALSFEEMSTLLCQVEAILNSRPYSALSSNPNDLDALTPGHFLIGIPLTTLPEADIPEAKVSSVGRWQHLQAMLQGFWRRWRQEYITSLQERTKWRKREGNIQPGDLVLIKEDNLPPSKWLLGRILACHPGSDNLVRVVTIKTHRGVLDRSINKVARLPIS